MYGADSKLRSRLHQRLTDRLRCVAAFAPASRFPTSHVGPCCFVIFDAGKRPERTSEQVERRQ